MDDSRRILRYVIPGVIYFLSTAVLTGILFPAALLKYLGEVLKSENAFGSVVGGVVASGGLGYIFSAAHHVIHNQCSWRAPIDYSACLNRLMAAGRLSAETENEPARMRNPPGFTRAEALPVLLSIWWRRVRSNKSVGAVQEEVSRLHDTLHGSGTARVAVAFALVTTLVIAGNCSERDLTQGPILRFISMLFVAGFAIAIFWFDYYRLGQIAQQVLELTLSDTLEQEQVTRSIHPE